MGLIPMNELLVDRAEPGIEVWTLNRPHSRNALTSTLARRLIDEMSRAGEDSETRSVILTGAGQAFCAGLDLKEFSNPDAPRAVVGEAIRQAYEFPKALIGAINGPAVTGGLELALACDTLIGSPLAAFRDTHLRIGAMSGSGLTVQLPRAVGQRWARRMILTGEPMRASTAEMLGLLTEIVEPEQLRGRAIDLGLAIASADATLASEVKQLCVAIDRVPAGQGSQLEAEALQKHRERGRAWSTT